MIYYLFLDDERRPSDVKWIELPLYPWTIVRSYDDFVKVINKNGIPAYVTFDHDLGQEAYDEANFQKFLKFDYSKLKEKTGMDCAKFLVEKCIDLGVPHPQYSVHSMNPIGKENIEKYIEGYNKNIKRG